MQRGRSLVAETPSEIKQRYEDTSLIIFKEFHQSKAQGSANFLSLGSSRRTVEYSNYGNNSVIVRRKKTEEATTTPSESQILMRVPAVVDIIELVRYFLKETSV